MPSKTLGLVLALTVLCGAILAAPSNRGFVMGFGKRSPYSQFQMGFGKRSDDELQVMPIEDLEVEPIVLEEQMPEKRYNLNRFQMGLGKRDVDKRLSQFHMGLGKRAAMYMGLGKRQVEEPSPFYPKKAFHMGLGKR